MHRKISLLGVRKLILFPFALLLGQITPRGFGDGDTPRPLWTSPNRFRILLTVDPKGRERSHSPANVEIDFAQWQSQRGAFDEHTVAVIGYGPNGEPRVFDPSRQGIERFRLPHRVDPLFGATKVTLNFVMPDHRCTHYAVYFDTVESNLGRRQRYHGLVGNGDRFSEGFQRREIGASHFDQFVDFDGDGDLDLCKGGVEPFVHCYENSGGNRLVDRGRLASGGELFVLPRSNSNRSWVTVAFHDFDGDGDQDFFPSFGDGPDAGKIIFYRNTTRGQGGQLTFQRVGPLQTISGVALAGGAETGGWFPSITFVRDWDGDGDNAVDALVGSNHRCWLYRGLGTNADGSPKFAEAVAVQAGGADIALVNPRFDCADIDGDGDLDLFAGTQPGPVYWFKNVGGRAKPAFAGGVAVAWTGDYLIGDAHSGATVVDLDGDGMPDLLSGRFWERVDLKDPKRPRVFGGFFRNVGQRLSPRFEMRKAGSPFTERFQICDAIRQNCVRAVDWNRDGRLDLLAGDTDGFVWLFRNKGDGPFARFAQGERLRAGGSPLSLAASRGHARLDLCDWNNDGLRDVMVADGSGTVTLFLNQGSKKRPALRKGQKVAAGGKPIEIGARASVLVCDWNNDGRKDLIVADDRGYYFCRNTGDDRNPALAAPEPILFGGKTVRYVRPNLGSFVDWDGDGKRDLIACHFENSIRFYRNLGTGSPGAEPQFSDPEGAVILRGESPQMISGADAVDWNGDGDLDLLTGQGHGGSGLRFYERDWIEDELRNTHPAVRVQKFESKANR